MKLNNRNFDRNIFDEIPALVYSFQQTFLHQTKESRNILYDDYTDEVFIAGKLTTQLRKDPPKEYRDAYRNPWRLVKHYDELFDIVRDQIRDLPGNRVTVKRNLEQHDKMKIWWFDELSRVMSEIGFCCGRWLRFEMRQIMCSGKRGCRIRTDHTKYYRYKDWTYCECCFNKQKPSIELDRNVAKTEFKEYVWISQVDEEFVDCKYCGRRFHQICVIYLKNAHQSFACRNCGYRPELYRASQLPQTDCDEFIQQFLKLNNLNLDDLVTIRCLSHVRKTMAIPESVKTFRTIHHVAYIDCSLYMFLETDDGVDVSFFAVYFQLYGDDCDESMRKSVYISFIDSIKLLPDDCRRKFHHFVLLGLLAYWKTQGYERVFIWSVPSEPHNDYIFHKKPPPKTNEILISKSSSLPQKKLNEWYREIFSLGNKYHIIESYSNFTKYFKENVKSLHQIPYYQGDLWSSKMIDSISELKKDMIKLQYNTSRKHKLSKKCKNGKICKPNLEGFDMRAAVWEKMEEQIDALGSDYFCLILSEHEDPTTQITQIEYSDFIKPSIFSDRLDLTDFLWSHNLEFSSMRRATYSTQYLLNYFLQECGSQSEVNIDMIMIHAEDVQSSLSSSNKCIVVMEENGWDSFDEMNTTLTVFAFQSDESRKSIDELCEASLILSNDPGYFSWFSSEDISEDSTDDFSVIDSEFV